MSMPRFFLYSYGDLKNFKISKSKGLFGCKSTSNIKKKFFRLHEGDIILIRDSSEKNDLEFFGHGVVTGKPYDTRTQGLVGQEDDAHSLLWLDEVNKKEIIYPWRVAVDFNGPPSLKSLHKITWDDILNLEWKNLKEGKVMRKQALGKFFSGNFVEEDKRFSSEDIKAFVKLIGVASCESKEGGYEEETIDDRRLKEIGDAGEQFIFKLLKREFDGSEFEVIWTSRKIPTSPYDIQVNRFNKPYLYIEVKTTIRGNLSAGAFISENEVQYIAKHPNRHRLYYVIYDGNISDNPSEVYDLKEGDYELKPIKYQLKACGNLKPINLN